MGRLEDTRCPSCGETVIERRGFRVERNRLTSSGNCPGCGTSLPGVWRGPGGHRQEADDLIHIRCG